MICRNAHGFAAVRSVGLAALSATLRKSGISLLLVAALWLCAPASLPAQTFTTLASFNFTDGDYPVEVPVQATNGNLYGTTMEGGVSVCIGDVTHSNPHGKNIGCGTVFEITPSGTLTTLYNFCSQSGCADGSGPTAGLVQGTDGNLYGMARGGGANGFGTFFKITLSSGTLTTLHSFNGTDGNGYLSAALVQGADGNFYGTTESGPANAPGSVFKITPSGTVTTLHSFDGTDGAEPNGLVQGTDGNFYGTTYTGGDIPNQPLGTVFKITPSGTFTSLLSFNGADGGSPAAGLVQGANGNFYGTTSTTFFEVTPSGTLTTLHTFNGMDGSGSSAAGLVQGADGNFYGITKTGGANGYGTVFKITPTGVLTMLHSFCAQGGASCTDGRGPGPGLVQDTNGTLYGTTFAGGASDDGTIFSLAVGLSPFVETLPTSGTVGAAVMILGTNLTGATAVTFNGTAAVFKVVSASEITTAVPSGATTGEVEVATPRGTFSSNVSFRVP
jgi:uncharacterized repeat protein (TIGR03803 family)